MSNTKLMRAMGAPRFDPIPPDQYTFHLDDEDKDVNRYVAWVMCGTIAVNHPSAGYEPRSPWVVDEKGKALRVEDAAAYFGWDPAYARRMHRQAEAQGRVRADRVKGHIRRIYLRGTVKPTAVLDEEPEKTSAEKGEEKGNTKDCTRYVPPYILFEINKRPKKEQEAILREEALASDAHDRRLADAAAVLRRIRDQEQDTRFQKYGLPPRRKIAESKQKRKPGLPLTIQLKLVDLDLVQSSEESRTVQGPNPDPAQSSYPLLVETSIVETTTTGQSAPSDALVVVEKIRKYGGTINKEAAQKLLNQCRTRSPGCTLTEIVAAIDTIGPTLTNRTRNRTAVFVTGVPPLVATNRESGAPKPETKQSPKCHICNKPLQGGSIQGSHFECFEAASQQRTKRAVSIA